MKKIIYIAAATLVGLNSCKKLIDVAPQSNLSTATYYRNVEEMRGALTGCYNGLHAPLFNEWQFTELRSDNAKMGQPGSTASANRDLSDLDIFIPATSQQQIYNYWLNTYNNIRNCNVLLQKLGVVYDPATGTHTFNNIDVAITEVDRKQVAGEAMFLRAYHYFNLVRLFGGVFLIYEPTSPTVAKTLNRTTEQEMYKLIVADLSAAIANMNTLRFNQVPAADKGRATGWAAKGMLAKVYLTLGRKAEAIPLLQDVIANSGHALQPAYADVFSTNNEVNAEILFTVRYKAGGLALGSPFGNNFAPLGSGSNIINGDGDGLNYPTAELDTLTNGDLRKPTLIKAYTATANPRLYVTKYLFPVVLTDDGESDWPIVRYADILLMLAEAQGFTPASIDLINSVRPRAGKPNYTTATITSVAEFERALSEERRIEFAFENHRWFDIVRYNTTFSTITAQQIMRDHFADEYEAHYSDYLPPTPTLAELQGSVTAQRLLLPIPQREIDNNTQLIIPQNPGY